METQKSKYIKEQLRKKMVEEIVKNLSKQSKSKTASPGLLIWGGAFLTLFLIIRLDIHTALPSYFSGLILILFIALICIYGWIWNHSIKKKYLKEIEKSYYENQHEYSSHQNESPEKGERFSAINKHYMKASKITTWDWMMITPIVVMCGWFLINEHTGINIPELNSSNRFLFLLLSVFSFGFLMTVVGSAKKGRVSVYFGRGFLSADRVFTKEKNPILFFFIISIYLIAAFGFCVYTLYCVLSNLF